MATLEDLIDIPLDKISDEELEHIIIHGRLAREEITVSKTRSAKKASAGSNLNIDFSEFE